MPNAEFRYPEEHMGAPVVLKEGPLFYLWTPDQKVHPSDGLFYQDTHYLSRLEWRLCGQVPTVLSASVAEGSRAYVDMANPDLVLDGLEVPPRTIHMLLTTVASRNLHQRLRVESYLDRPVQVTLSLHLLADFRDVFEVRGWVRTQRGSLRPPEADLRRTVFRYDGRDGLTMHTVVRYEPRASAVRVGESGEVEVRFSLTLSPRTPVHCVLEVVPGLGEPPPREQEEEGHCARAYARAAQRQTQAYRAWEASCTRVETDNPVYDASLRQAMLDLRTLCTEYPGEGTIVDAGIPWYVAPFGRDSIITGIESLLLTPQILVDALRFLAHHQGTRDDPWRDEEPGKILHELRRGEMARCGEIPHTPYYGSVDSTLWWIMGLAEAYRFTGHRELVLELEAPLRRALEWVRRYGDVDGDMLLEYRRRSQAGLENQGWKDSHDSVLDHHGSPLTPPIALVEVQGYAYRALVDGAYLLGLLGDRSTAAELRAHARELRQAFLQRFWDPQRRRVAYALDGAKRPVWHSVSNVGHLLFTGILPARLAEPVLARLFDPSMTSGYGIRTLSREAPFYNPMSYHNGSVWPHDNALIAWGLRTVGERRRLVQVAQELHEAASHFPYGRLPELYGGFAQRGAGPVRYPVACNPQAWSVAVPVLLLRLLLGIEAEGHRLVVRQPMLPPWVDYLLLRDLRVAGGIVDIEFARHSGVTYANFLRVEGDVRPSILPA